MSPECYPTDIKMYEPIPDAFMEVTDFVQVDEINTESNHRCQWRVDPFDFGNTFLDCEFEPT